MRSSRPRLWLHSVPFNVAGYLGDCDMRGSSVTSSPSALLRNQRVPKLRDALRDLHEVLQYLTAIGYADTSRMTAVLSLAGLCPSAYRFRRGYVLHSRK